MSENNGHHRNPKFALGQIVATPGALTLLEQSDDRPERFLQRHVSGDWGDVCAGDAALNDEAVINGDRILSAYTTATACIQILNPPCAADR
jgi:hypothetical protein